MAMARLSRMPSGTTARSKADQRRQSLIKSCMALSLAKSQGRCRRSEATTRRRCDGAAVI